MRTDDIKKNMMKLWKDVFHDSDTYINLIFDHYFNVDLIEYHEENGCIISALLGVPYEFGCGENKLRGLYLCGLATDEEFRNRGIMNNLIERINSRAKDYGFAFTFLIPSSDALINYYSVRGYINAMYRVEDCYTQIHNFEKDYFTILNGEDDRIIELKRKYYYSLNVDVIDVNNDKHLIEDIVAYIRKYETNISTYLSIQHSERDIRIIIKENKISGGNIFVSYTPNGKLSGVAFATTDYRKRIVISKIFYDDNCSMYRILDYVKKVYPDSPISLYCYPEESDRRAIWMKVYGASNPDGGNLEGSYGIAERVYDVSKHARPYGMIRIVSLHEILKFLANYRSDAKFSILVNVADRDDNSLKCDINDGEVSFSLVNQAETKGCFNKNNNGVPITSLNEKELLELLFRKKDNSNLIIEAFGIPRIPTNISLMLD